MLKHGIVQREALHGQITIEQKRMQESLLSQKEHVLDFSCCECYAHPRMKECFFSPDLIREKGSDCPY